MTHFKDALSNRVQEFPRELETKRTDACVRLIYSPTPPNLKGCSLLMNIDCKAATADGA